MSPRAMAAQAAGRGIGLFALTDHNSALDCPAFALACARSGVLPLFGLELNSAEEAHLLAIFPTPLAALAFGSGIRAFLPDYPWDPESFGDQPVVDEAEGLAGFEERWLCGALDLSFDELALRAAGAGAIVIPAHVDRPMYSVYSQLGFLPPGPWDAVESMGSPPIGLTGGAVAISGSDAHFLEHIGRRSTLVELALQPVLALGAALASLAAGGWSDGPVRHRIDLADSAGTLYEEFLSDERLRLYPEAEARVLFEELRSALRAGRVNPGFLPFSPIRPSGG